MIRVVLLLGGFNPAPPDGAADEVAHVESWDWWTLVNGDPGPLVAEYPGPPLEYDVEVESVQWVNR